MNPRPKGETNDECQIKEHELTLAHNRKLDTFVGSTMSHSHLRYLTFVGPTMSHCIFALQFPGLNNVPCEAIRIPAQRHSGGQALMDGHNYTLMHIKNK